MKATEGKEKTRDMKRTDKKLKQVKNENIPFLTVPSTKIFQSHPKLKCRLFLLLGTYSSLIQTMVFYI